MSGSFLHLAVEVAAGATGTISAVCWVAAAKIYVISVNTSGEGALIGGAIVTTMPDGKRMDVVETLKKQIKWNFLAACAAAATAVFSTVAIFV